MSAWVARFTDGPLAGRDVEWDFAQPWRRVIHIRNDRAELVAGYVGLEPPPVAGQSVYILDELAGNGAGAIANYRLEHSS